ncbi:hypothetical protein MKK68_02180 [Methylobacterium sp. E-016]|uniref:hypothetical protein n=1 Tax=Methylobacterium sp. E-016 TaxID=2836556 RepID=UPI001FBAD7C3|nr:hypothetical protein [Methylobacterium sp. E-016]MCJ2074469.1 hypothetical protein [Methylobacterium sp. E-016]
MIRGLAALALALAAGAAVAGERPRAGFYCPADSTLPISVDVGEPGLGIDGVDCAAPRYARGRVTAPRCYSNGGSASPLDTDLAILPGGALRHDGRVYAPRPPGPIVPGRSVCP